jgi:hypothetical protein
MHSYCKLPLLGKTRAADRAKPSAEMLADAAVRALGSWLERGGYRGRAAGKNASLRLLPDNR